MLRNQINITNGIILLIVLALLIGGHGLLNVLFVLLLLLSTLILIIFDSSYQRFLFIIALVLLTGVLLVIKNEFYMQSTFMQIKVSVTYAMYAVCSFLIWFNSHIADSENKKMIEIEEELERYIEKEGANKLLTRAEFNYKKKFILKGATIRDEDVVFISIELRNYNRPQANAVVSKIGVIIGEILTEEYDIYTLDSYRTYHIVLQNSNKENALKFKENLLVKIEEEMNIKDKYIKVNIEEINRRKSKEIVL